MTAEVGFADLIGRLWAAGSTLVADFECCPGIDRLAIPDFQAAAARAGTLQKDVRWRNDLFVGRGFRQVHIESFSIVGQLGILHVCIFPELDRNAPIFGFDIIAGKNKATGAFLDLSPTTRAADTIVQAWASATIERRAQFVEKRSLPDWAEAVFSPAALAIRPVSTGDVERALALGRWSLAMLLGAELSEAAETEMFEAQTRYVEAQRRNEHTFRMLAGCVGADLAREFIDIWLFPDPPLPRPPRVAERAIRHDVSVH
jgi:phycocyanobilin:ferredoxin oxidoreductase